MTRPGSGDGLQGLDLIIFYWSPNVGAVIREWHQVGPEEKPHESEASILEGSEKPGRHVDGLGLGLRNMVFEGGVLLEDDS